MIRIGTRTSKLAMIQTELVKQKIQEHFPKEKIEIVPIITKGRCYFTSAAGFVWWKRCFYTGNRAAAFGQND